VSRFGSVLRHAWNVFSNQDDKTQPYSGDYGSAYAYRPDRVRLRIPNERSIIVSIYTRLSIDVASIDMRHIRTDDDDRYKDDIDSGLQNCLTVEANIDQAAQAFRMDVALTLFDKGVAAIVPVDTSLNPLSTGGYDIITLRVGEIVQWYPEHVQVWLYNQALGYRQLITLPKTVVAIVENPLYAVMNEPNSTLQRLLNKLNLLDAVDDASASGKLDLIIQLPYVIKSEARRQAAEQRRQDIEFQLKGSKYGIAYTDGTEKITQLNRPAENNLMAQIEFLTQMLYGQLGLTDAVMNGTADEKTMLNYWNRTIDPTLNAIAQAMRRSFLTKTARTQNQTIEYFRDPFRLIPIENIAKIADVFSRNEIMSANEIRQVLGLRPSTDPKADKLINSNIRGQTPSGFSQVSG
jgi:putative sterol carrier protein